MTSRTILLACCVLVSGIPAVSAQDAEAERLFNAMEQKIRAGQGVEIAFAYTLEKKTAKGSLVMANENKVRLHVEGAYTFGMPRGASFTLVSDGMNYKTKGAKFIFASNGKTGFDPDGQSEGQAPRNFRRTLTAMFSRGGVGPIVLALPYASREAIDPDGEESSMKTYAFKDAGTEKVGDRPAKVVRYRYGKGSGSDDAFVTIWIDSATGLPLKRSLEVKKVNPLRIDETYGKVEVQAKVDAKVFELSATFRSPSQWRLPPVPPGPPNPSA